MTLDALKSEINKLPSSDRAALAQWIADQDAAAWDAQIKADYDAGKLDSLIKRAQQELKDGAIREAP